MSITADKNRNNKSKKFWHEFTRIRNATFMLRIEEQYALNINVKIHYNTFSKYSDSSGRKNGKLEMGRAKERETWKVKRETKQENGRAENGKIGNVQLTMN